MVYIAKDADFGGKQKQIAADQRKVNVAGDSVCIYWPQIIWKEKEKPGEDTEFSHF